MGAHDWKRAIKKRAPGQDVSLLGGPIVRMVRETWVSGRYRSPRSCKVQRCAPAHSAQKSSVGHKLRLPSSGEGGPAPRGVAVFRAPCISRATCCCNMMFCLSNASSVAVPSISKCILAFLHQSLTPVNLHRHCCSCALSSPAGPNPLLSPRAHVRSRLSTVAGPLASQLFEEDPAAPHHFVVIFELRFPGVHSTNVKKTRFCGNA